MGIRLQRGLDSTCSRRPLSAVRIIAEPHVGSGGHERFIVVRG